MKNERNVRYETHWRDLIRALRDYYRNGGASTDWIAPIVGKRSGAGEIKQRKRFLQWYNNVDNGFHLFCPPNSTVTDLGEYAPVHSVIMDMIGHYGVGGTANVFLHALDKAAAWLRTLNLVTKRSL